MPDIYEIGPVIVTGGENPEIRFGETEMTLFRDHAYRLPQTVTGKAYETNLASVLKFEKCDEGLFGGFKKYLRDEIGVNVVVGGNTAFRKEGENIVIEWKGEERPCVTKNNSTLNPEEYEKLKELAMSLCAK
jgi:hypothetical protein